MLLVHQSGAVKIGEVVRYTLTYTPSNDRILPTPSHLHLKIKNTSAIPLRAAWVHGPYTLHCAAYPANFNPHQKIENPKQDGTPEYEPMVKAGGSWSSKLLVPDRIRETGADLGRRKGIHPDQNSLEHEDRGSVTWIVEIASQILFSNSASVHFEVLVGRDERSLEMGFAAVAGHGHGVPGDIKHLQSVRDRQEARRKGHVQTQGVYSKAVRLVVEDTETLWDKPALPTWEDEDDASRENQEAKKEKKEKKRRNVHLVIVTHGLHSNLGADMLFLKESIDATVAQARLDARKRKQAYREKSKGEQNVDDRETSTAPVSGGQEELDNAPDESDDEEETIVRGFSGNAVRTENGIQYLGKRLAKYILRFTYPDQPFLPIKKSLTRRVTDTFTNDTDKANRDGKPAHQGSSVHTPPKAQSTKPEDLPYKFTSISFIGHSLGGLIQTYAIAYIHKHSPAFFQQIEPINFICMASPMLGLSNENPMYVKFALDFGLVGRTGQDLGLTWRPPTLASKGWNVMMNGFGATTVQKDEHGNKQEDASAKPLLRVLPSGPAHQVLKLFRNRTLYSNVVNDGIVPLRTSCLLFLDWRGLGKVDKARRENGLIGTVAEWGWAELTGANASSNTTKFHSEQPWESEDDGNVQTRQGQGDAVPLPGSNETADDNRLATSRVSFDEELGSQQGSTASTTGSKAGSPRPQEKGMLDTFIGFFRSNPPQTSKKTTKALRRGQTVYQSTSASSEDVSTEQEGGTSSNPTMRPQLPHIPSHRSTKSRRAGATRGDSLSNAEAGEVQAPPKTSIFESAGDILHPPLPSKQWITDPSTRSRTIFHDRVYHPEDIPRPPMKRSSTKASTSNSPRPTTSSTDSIRSSDTTSSSVDASGMKVEEKIARAYHRDLSWRKVLVRLEPDAHNNMIVRRMFANAYGWPVVKHLCDTHFADTHAARTRDEEETGRERAKPMDAPVSKSGERVKEQTDRDVTLRTRSETREAKDELTDLDVVREGAGSTASSRGISSVHPGIERKESAVWDDSFFEGSDGEDSDTVDERNLVARIINPNYALPRRADSSPPSSPPAKKKVSTGGFTDGHRGLAPTSSPKNPKAPKQVVKSVFDSAEVDEPVIAESLVEEPETMLPTSPGSSVAAKGLGLKLEDVSPSISRTATKKEDEGLD